MTLNDVLALVRLTLKDPRAAFSALLSLNPPAEARWLALGAVVLLAVITTQIALLGVPADVALPGFEMMRRPFSAVIGQTVTVLALAFGASHVAGLFGGTARFGDALWLVVWVEFMMVLAEVIILAVSVLIPPLADLLGLAAVVLFFWLLTHMTMMLNGFRRTLPTFLGIVGMLLVAGTAAVLLLSALGMQPLPPAQAAPAVIGLN